MAIKKILLTGADGFIGGYFYNELEHRGFEFLNISNSSSTRLPPDKHVKLSLSDREGLMKTIESYRPDAVVHMAAIASPVYHNPSEIYDVNVCGTENLLEAVKKSCPNGVRVLLFSTAGVYGNQDTLFLEETLPVRPVNHYSSSKAVMEFLCQNYSDCMDVRILRPFNIIGKGQSEIFIAPKLVRAFKDRVPEISLGNVSAMRDYVSVEFCAAAALDFLLCDEIDYPVLNICTGIGHTVHELFEALVSITGHKPKTTISNQIVRHNEIWRLVGCVKRLNMIADSSKLMSLRSVLMQMLD